MHTNFNHYYIMTFETTTDVMRAESLLKQLLPIAVMPIPKEISSGCGLALRFMSTEEAALLDYLKTFSIQGTLYKMETIKVNGNYPIKKIMVFPNVT